MFCVINKNLFVNTDSFDCVVTVEKEGKLLEKKALEAHVAPLSEEIYELPVKGADPSGRVCDHRFFPSQRGYDLGGERP